MTFWGKQIKMAERTKKYEEVLILENKEGVFVFTGLDNWTYL